MGKAARNHGGTGGHGCLPLPGERPNFNRHVMSDKDLQNLVTNKARSKLANLEGQHADLLKISSGKLLGNPVKLPGNGVKVSGTPIIKVLGTPVKPPGTSAIVPGISVKLPRAQVKLSRTPAKLEGIQDKPSVKLLGTPCNLSETKVKQPGTEVPLSKAPLISKDCTQVNQSGAPVGVTEVSVILPSIQSKVPGTPIQMSGNKANLAETPVKLPETSAKHVPVEQQVIFPEPIVQTQLLQTLTTEHISSNSVKPPGTQVKLPMTAVELPDVLVKLPIIPPEMSETQVKQSGIQYKLPGTLINLDETPAVNLIGTTDNIPRSSVILEGTQAMMLKAQVKQQVTLTEQIVQTEQEQKETLTSNHQPSNLSDQPDDSVVLVQHPSTKDYLLED